MLVADNKVVLITGASSGIGEATARVLAASGARVVLGGRRTDRLKRIASEIEGRGGSVRLRVLDVANLDDIRAFADFAEAEFGKIDVIVNNAGVMPLSPLSALKIHEWNWMIDVNIRGVLHGIAAVLPKMEAQGHGHVVNVSSIGGFVVQPTAAVYAATKFAVRAISEGLRKETDKIRCTCVYPGVVAFGTRRNHQRRHRSRSDEDLPQNRDPARRHRPRDPVRHRATERY
jgi:NADP-dependent 3-hydroxy acid dehydrogenase YdfG